MPSSPPAISASFSCMPLKPPTCEMAACASSIDLAIRSGSSRTSFSPGTASASPFSIGLVENCSSPCLSFSGSESTDSISCIILLLIALPSSEFMSSATSAIFSCSLLGSFMSSATSGFAFIIASMPFIISGSFSAIAGFAPIIASMPLAIIFCIASGSFIISASSGLFIISLSPAPPMPPPFANLAISSAISLPPLSAADACSPYESTPTRRGRSCACAEGAHSVASMQITRIARRGEVSMGEKRRGEVLDEARV
mmetsp:Transcript_38234/g.95095  ORF Transcript_38234/g.95095 Transcript_38234/m.95095 type:complete len:256 (-) Transcript_38234:126-893(-)